MNSPRNYGTPVDPPRSIVIDGVFRENLSEYLLASLVCENGELSRQKLQSLHAKVKELQGESDSTKGKTGQDHTWERRVHLDPDSSWANCFRNKMRREVGDDFNEIAYKVINMIPDPDWMEFARTTLKVDEDTEQRIRGSSSLTTDIKYEMIKDWKKSRKKAGQSASGEELLNLAVDFMIRKGKVSRTDHMWDRHGHVDAESALADHYRDELKEKFGSDFIEVAYKVINMIPDPDWMEFARTALKVDEEAEQRIRGSSSLTTDIKYEMIKDWKEKSRKRAGQNASAGELLDLAADFLIRKGKVSRIVQQNFNGTINCQTFNGYVNNQGPQVQASA